MIVVDFLHNDSPSFALSTYPDLFGQVFRSLYADCGPLNRRTRYTFISRADYFVSALFAVTIYSGLNAQSYFGLGGLAPGVG